MPSPRYKLERVEFLINNQRFTLQLMDLTLCILDIFYAFCRLIFFSKIFYLEKLFQENHQSAKQFESTSGQIFCQA